MAQTGVPFRLNDKDKEFAITYVEESGLYKNRLSDFLGISRPTLDKIMVDSHPPGVLALHLLFANFTHKKTRVAAGYFVEMSGSEPECE